MNNKETLSADGVKITKEAYAIAQQYAKEENIRIEDWITKVIMEYDLINRILYPKE